MEEEVKPKEDINTKLNHLKDHVNDYVKTYAEILKARTVKGASNVTAAMIVIIAAFFMIFSMLFFIAFGLGWWLGDVLNSRAGGFFAVGGLFLLLCILLFALRRSVIKPMIRNMFISKVYE